MSTPTRPARAAKANPILNLLSWLAEQRKGPMAPFYVAVAATFALAGFGWIMVFNASTAVAGMSGSVWTEGVKQGIMLTLGAIAFFIMLRVPLDLLGRWSIWLYAGSMVLLSMLFFGFGVGGEEVGSNSWLVLGPLRMQPSELGKLCLGIWGAWNLAEVKRRYAGTDGIQPIFPFFCGALGMLLAVLLQGDFGMTLTIGITAMTVFYFFGLSNRLLLILLSLFAVVGVVNVYIASFRSSRISTWFKAFTLNFGSAEDNRGTTLQSYQGLLSIADGGIGGVGLGESRAKWSYLPEAKNDFIFAVIAEETGLIGALMVIILFLCIAWAGITTARRHSNIYLSLLSATLTVGVVAQAFINMCCVLGLLPVTGIQLPMISAGGTSALITFATLGIICSCARHTPDAVSHLEAHPPRRGISWLFGGVPKAVPEPILKHRERGGRWGSRPAEDRLTTPVADPGVAGRRRPGPHGPADPRDSRPASRGEEARRYGRAEAEYRGRWADPQRDPGRDPQRRPARRPAPRPTPGPGQRPAQRPDPYGEDRGRPTASGRRERRMPPAEPRRPRPPQPRNQQPRNPQDPHRRGPRGPQ